MRAQQYAAQSYLLVSGLIPAEVAASAETAMWRLLKANPQTAGIPIVALSAHARHDDRRAALEAGCVEYIAKPIDTRALPAQLAAVLKGP